MRNCAEYRTDLPPRRQMIVRRPPSACTPTSFLTQFDRALVARTVGCDERGRAREGYCSIIRTMNRKLDCRWDVTIFVDFCGVSSVKYSSETFSCTVDR